MKKIVLLLTLALLILGSFSYAIEIEEISPCPIHGIHEMIYQGGQVVKYNGQSMPYSIYLYECDCGEKMLMTGLPHMYGYTIQEYWYDTEFKFQLDVFGQGYYELDMYDGHESDASTLPGYRFYDNPEW